MREIASEGKACCQLDASPEAAAAAARTKRASGRRRRRRHRLRTSLALLTGWSVHACEAPLRREEATPSWLQASEERGGCRRNFERRGRVGQLVRPHSSDQKQESRARARAWEQSRVSAREERIPAARKPDSKHLTSWIVAAAPPCRLSSRDASCFPPGWRLIMVDGRAGESVRGLVRRANEPATGAAALLHFSPHPVRAFGFSACGWLSTESHEKSSSLLTLP